MNSPYPRLFEPIRICASVSRNRVMRLATTTNTGANGVASERTVAFYRALARGGTGVIVTESMRVHASNAARDAAMLAYDPRIVPSLARLADAVHGEGSLLIAQLNHGGRQHHANLVPTLWAPSALACPHSGGIPHEMSRAEIASLVQGFVASARHAREAGMDGVEIHGAQGHLIQEFISPFSNRRSDEYGGSLENRLRFAREILSAVRDAMGPDVIVGYRMGVDEFEPGGLTTDDSVDIAHRLVELGVCDYLSLAQGTFNTLDTHLPDSHYPPLTYVDLHARIKAAAPQVPVVTSSRIQTPEQAESILSGGKADMVGLCRALVADPEWPLKAASGRREDIRVCVSTSQCWGWIVEGRRIACSINPTLGFELDLPPLARSAAARRVVVIGGGPSGLEAARTAAECGHEVVLFESAAELGGKLARARQLLPAYEAGNAVAHLARQVVKLGVDVRIGTRATVAGVRAERPSAVIVATGATIIAPPVSGDGSVPVLACGSELPAQLPPGEVVVMDEDGYFWAAAVTETLAQRGTRVIYVTRFFEALREVPEVTRIAALRALDKLGVGLRPTMFVDRIERGGVSLRHYYNRERVERRDGVGAILWLGVQRANDALAHELLAAGVDNVKVVGDAHAPRRLANAIAEGHRAARAV